MSQPYIRNCLRAAKRQRLLEPSSPSILTTSPPQRRSHNTSVSASEVSHFTALAASWWDPHGPSRLLHLMNPLRHEFIRSCIGPDPPDKRYKYLDVGCGGGIFASSAARLRHTESVTAIDPTTEVIEVARRKQREDPLLMQAGKLRYLNCAIEELGTHTTTTEQSQLQSHLQSQQREKEQQKQQQQQPPEQYDILTLFEVIEHLQYPTQFLQQCLTHLRPGGWLILSTIARHPISYLTTKIIAEAPWPIGVVPRGTHTWEQYINPGELEGWFEKENNKYNRELLVEGSRPEGVDEKEAMRRYGDVRVGGCVYVPLVGWRWVNGSERFGNYFLGVQKLVE